MRIESNYPTPIQGVSTLAARNRARGQAGVQLNLRSDPVTKLTRRPSLKWTGLLATTANDVTIHTYYRKGNEYQLLIDQLTGDVTGFIDGVSKPVVGDLSVYGSETALVLETINDTTFVLNPTVQVELDPTTDADNNTIHKIVHLNVTSALNYGESIDITISATGMLTTSFTITIPGAVDQDLADAARKTNQVAEDITAGVNNSGTAFLSALQKGSSVAISYVGADVWPTVEVSSGAGDDDVVAFNQTIEDLKGLPLYAVVGTRLKVQPFPTETGTYYLTAVGIDGQSFAESPYQMSEVVWTESRSPDEPFAFDAKTMPHTILYDGVSFIVGEPEDGWQERTKGDNESVQVPKFVGNTITALGQFQKRLVLVSEDVIEMTVTDNLFNWWKQSAIDLLVTDPISISSNSTGIDVLQDIVEHNRDLLVTASNGQFKIDGSVGVTPQTVAMPLTMSQEIQVGVAPVTLGTAVFLPINYGESTGVIEYTGSRDQKDEATPITHHVIGYMEGEAVLFAGSPNLEMLAMTTSNAAQNELFIYEQFTNGGKKLQQSWSKWTLPEGNEILHISFQRDKLTLTVRVGSDILVKTIDMYSRVATNTEEVFLNDLLTLTSDGLTATVPSNYPTEGIIIVGGDNTKYPLFKVQYTRDGDTLTFSKDVSKGGTCQVYVGSQYKSIYEPTRPFREDKEGIAVTTDRIRVNRYTLSVVNTERVTMSVDAKYTEVDDQTKTFRVLNTTENRVGEVNLYTGDFQFSYGQNANDANVQFWTEGWLGMTIAGISWKGQYHKTSRRL